MQDPVTVLKRSCLVQSFCLVRYVFSLVCVVQFFIPGQICSSCFVWLVWYGRVFMVWSFVLICQNLPIRSSPYVLLALCCLFFWFLWCVLIYMIVSFLVWSSFLCLFFKVWPCPVCPFVGSGLFWWVWVSLISMVCFFKLVLSSLLTCLSLHGPTLHLWSSGLHGVFSLMQGS